MAHRVDPAKDEVQRTAMKTSLDGAAADPSRCELPTRHDPMLPLGERRDDRIGRLPSPAVSSVFAIASMTKTEIVAATCRHDDKLGLRRRAGGAPNVTKCATTKAPARRYRPWL